MSSSHRTHVEAADGEVDAAQGALVAALESAQDDDAVDRINAAADRLRVAQARRTATQTGLEHLPDLTGP